jgi:hypothetical protein
MAPVKLNDMSFGEFQNFLVKTVMDKMDSSFDQSPLVYFPIVHDRVESFLLVHWEEAWENCSTMTTEEWEASSCYEVFKQEVLDEFTSSKNIEPSPSSLNEKDLYEPHH